MNIARFKDMSFHLERIPLSIFTVITRSGQKWTDKICIIISTKLSKEEISKYTEKEHHKVKGNVKKGDNKKQCFDRQDEEKLGENEGHIAIFSSTDIESNSVTL